MLCDMMVYDDVHDDDDDDGVYFSINQKNIFPILNHEKIITK